MVHTQVDIAATPQQIRSVLLDFPKFAEWNKSIPHIEVLSSPEGSQPVPGSRLKCRIAVLNSDIKPTVIKNTEDEFSWKGVLFTDLIFCGVHYFRFEKIDEVTTRLHHGENFSGLLWGPYRAFAGEDKLEESFQDFADAMKKRVEELYP